MMNSYPMQIQYVQKQNENVYFMSTNPIKPPHPTSSTTARLDSGEDRAQLFLQRLFHQQATDVNQPQTSPAFINTFYMLAPPGFASLGNYAMKSNVHPHYNQGYDRNALLPSPILPYTYPPNGIEYTANEVKQYDQSHQPILAKMNNAEPDIKRENGDNIPNNFVKLRTTCDRCISLKAKCLRMKDTNKCARCFRGNHICNFSAQKKRGRVAKYDQLMMSIGSKRESPDSLSNSQDGSHEESDRDQEPSSSKKKRNDCRLSSPLGSSN